ncbi:MAG: hypothetical protein WCB31_10410 [Nitrososphaeraceae archaeon]
MESSDKRFISEIRCEQSYDKAISQMSEIILRTTASLDSIFDHDWIDILVKNSTFFDTIADFKIKQKGVSVRFITNIKQQNVSSCTKLIKFVELRHMDDIVGYLGISDRNQFFSYTRNISGKESNNKEHTINSKLNFIQITNKNFIKMQSIFFEKLWDLSVPANERIAEIKKETLNYTLLNSDISDQDKIEALISRIVRSAEEEILLFFPTTNSFWLCEESCRIIGLLSEAINKYIKINVLIHVGSEDFHSSKKIDQKIKQTNKILGTYVNYTTKKIEGQNTIIVLTDQAISLLISIKKGDKNRFRDAIDSATFSSSELNISTLLSVFASLWIRSDMEKQNITKQTYFRIFKEPQLKDEKYKRKWFFENTEK